MLIVGETPIARALEDVARAAGYDVGAGERSTRSRPTPLWSSPRTATTRRSRSTAALEAGVGYVGARREHRSAARAVLDSLDVDDALQAAIHTPAGLDIGARAPADIAISILAQMVAERTDARPGRRRPRPRSTRCAACR